MKISKLLGTPLLVGSMLLAAPAFAEGDNFIRRVPTKPDLLTFLLVAIGCYLIAVVTSQVFVTQVLPKRISSELGNQARFVGLDGIRGYLALGVFIHHYVIFWAYLQLGKWDAPPHNVENELGRASVAIFFMITAFLFWRRASTTKDLDLRKFIISRLFRIYPLFLLIFSLLCLGVAYKSGWAIHEPITTMSRHIASWFCFNTPAINGYKDTWMVISGVTWTLRYEALFYISLPFLVAIFLKKNEAWKKILALAIVAFLIWHFEPAKSIAPAFFGGIIAVYWGTDKRRIELLKGRTGSIIGIASVACVLFLLFKPFTLIGLALLTVFFVTISSGNTFFGLLETPFSLWLGEISYSIYLWHGIILWFAMLNVLPRFKAFHLTTAWFVAGAFCLTPIVVLLSCATHLLIEKPFIALGQRIARPKSKQVQTERLRASTSPSRNPAASPQIS